MEGQPPMFLESRFTNASRHARGVVAALPHADIRAGGGVSGQNIRMGTSSPGVLPPKPSLPVVQRPIKGRRLQHQRLNVAGKKTGYSSYLPCVRKKRPRKPSLIFGITFTGLIPIIQPWNSLSALQGQITW